MKVVNAVYNHISGPSIRLLVGDCRPIAVGEPYVWWGAGVYGYSGTRATECSAELAKKYDMRPVIMFIK